MASPLPAAPTLWTATALVAAGGGVGAVLRFHLGRMVHHLSPAASGAFPWGTLSANVLGSLAMGVLVGWLARYGTGGETWRLLLGVGLLGGFTTFSSFSLELVLLAQRGAIGAALAYALISVAAGVAGLLAGLDLMRGAA